MRLIVAAVGRARGSVEQGLVDTYRPRLAGGLDVREVPVAKARSAAERRRRESVDLRKAVPPGAKIVALDPRGRVLDSVAFAQAIADWRDGGIREVAFLIGGADGLDPALRSSADLVLSLGAMTWPHLLVRAMLAEQLFRAQCLLSGHPYHRND